jgi:hypothetical protein
MATNIVGYSIQKNDLGFAFLNEQLKQLQALYNVNYVLPYTTMIWTKLKDTTDVLQRYPIRSAVIEAFVETITKLPVLIDGLPEKDWKRLNLDSEDIDSKDIDSKDIDSEDREN